MDSKPVVAVAMSGGVDSSVAAALLVEQGYTVIGMMLRLWSEPNAERYNRCCTPDSMAMAKRVASQLSIPFYVLDARQYFYDTVVTPFINDYTHGLTPNPCLSCNRLVRWGFLLKHAMASGADYLATGHYARINQTPASKFQLLRALDTTKDQSYVLHVLTQNQLKHALFPLGEFRKTEVRRLAQQYSLPVAERPDSQDLCFVGSDGDYRLFLSRHAPQAIIPGQIKDQQGNLLGEHPGLAFFTIGQRKGLRIASPTPLYVWDKDISQNTLVVGPRERSGRKLLTAKDFNWISGESPQAPFTAHVKIRYSASDIPCLVENIDGNTIYIGLENPPGDISPGQAAVLYNGEVCLGGGIITNS